MTRKRLFLILPLLLVAGGTAAFFVYRWPQTQVRRIALNLAEQAASAEGRDTLVFLCNGQARLFDGHTIRCLLTLNGDKIGSLAVVLYGSYAEATGRHRHTAAARIDVDGSIRTFSAGDPSPIPEDALEAALPLTRSVRLF